MAAIYHRIISASPFGPVRLVWTKRDNCPRILRILLSRPMESGDLWQAPPLYPAAQSASCIEVETICAAIVGVLEGSEQDTGLDMVDITDCSLFQQSVLRIVCHIPHGCVSTYRHIARLTGNTNAARAVGQAVAANPFPLLIPCHRVICANGQAGAYQGGGVMKQALLARETVPLNASGRIIGTAPLWTGGAPSPVVSNTTSSRTHFPRPENG